MDGNLMAQEQRISKDEFCSQREKHIVNGTLYKGFRSAPSWNEKKRSARFVMSAEVEDRDGDVILTSGINLDEFAKIRPRSCSMVVDRRSGPSAIGPIM